MPRLTRLTSVDQVVEVLGGIAAVVALTGAQPKAAYHWRGGVAMFPARYHDLMTKALKKRGYTAPARLWNQVVIEPPKKKAA